MPDLIQKPDSIVDLFKKEIPPLPSWIAPAVLPKGGKLLLGAEAKAGKSFMALELARGLVTATSPFDHPFFQIPVKAKVLLFEQELGETGLQKRGLSIFNGIDYEELEPWLYYVSKEPKVRLDTPVGRDFIIKKIELSEPNVVILDPIGKMQSYEENSSSQIAKLWEHLDRMLKRFESTDMAFIITHHFGKPNHDPKWGGDPLSPYSFRGSSKWYDDPDTLSTNLRGEFLHGRDVEEDAWEITSRWESRNGETPPDMILHVNEFNDWRVRYSRNAAKKVKKKLPEIKKIKPPEDVDDGSRVSIKKSSSEKPVPKATVLPERGSLF